MCLAPHVAIPNLPVLRSRRSLRAGGLHSLLPLGRRRILQSGGPAPFFLAAATALELHSPLAAEGSRHVSKLLVRQHHHTPAVRRPLHDAVLAEEPRQKLVERHFPRRLGRGQLRRHVSWRGPTFGRVRRHHRGQRLGDGLERPALLLLLSALCLVIVGGKWMGAELALERDGPPSRRGWWEVEESERFEDEAVVLGDLRKVGRI
mmetsp:Transcript_34825/g.74190  ORF Transcript_34825/g.74190 Transcript_34825/m.74190 type:complete len:205 (+) Transcript_34825:1222-1836(+)